MITSIGPLLTKLNFGEISHVRARVEGRRMLLVHSARCRTRLEKIKIKTSTRVSEMEERKAPH